MNSAIKKSKTASLAMGGLFAAMSIIFTRFFALYIAGGSIRLSFGDIPLLLSGAMFGPVIGALTGIVADLAGMLMFGSVGPYFPGFTLTAALTGLIPGLILYKNNKEYKLWKIILTIFIVSIFVALILNTLWLTILLKKGFLVLLPGRIIARAIMAPIEIGILYLILIKSKIFNII